MAMDRDNNFYFKYPPLNLPVELCLDFHHEENPTHPAFIYPSPQKDRVQSCTYEEFVPGVHRAGRLLSEQIPSPVHNPSPRLVGIIVKTDLLTYLTILAGLMRAGIIVFPISYRFSSGLIAHLLERSHPVAVIVDSTTELLVVEAINACSGVARNPPALLQLPALTSLYPGHDEYTPLPPHNRKPDDISMLIHSSSSTSGFPNIVSWSSLAIIHHGEVEEMPSQTICGKILRGCDLEIFHSLTLCIFFMVVRRGLIMSFPNPRNHLANDDDEVFQSFEHIKPDFIVTNAQVVENWAESSQKIDILQKSGANVFYGGRFLSKTAGNKLVSSGVKLSTAYGSTETGPIAILPQFQGEDWEYFGVKPRPDLIFVPREDGLLELVVSPIHGDTNYLGGFNTTWEQRPAYNPGDLFTPHATKTHTYRMFGRLNDQILLASGITINPVDLEIELTRNPYISSAVMFGHRRNTVGVIIEPSDTSCLKKDILDAVWPTIVEANLKLPSHSKILRTMVIVAKENKPISLSLKGLPRRALVLQQYQHEIDTLYIIHE